MYETRPVTPAAAGRWPPHWLLPTEGDLQAMADGYRHGLLPPEHPTLNRPARDAVVGSAQCRDAAQRLFEVARQEAEAGQRPIGGLAAPQVGIPLRVVWYDSREQGQGPPQLGDLACVVNPVITPVGDATVRLPEGCPSTGRITGWVDRPQRVRLDGCDPDGTRIDRQYTGRAARVLQHEVDHLNGVRFPDRTTDRDLLWVSTHRIPEFVAHVKRVLGGDRVPGWEPRTPRDQWVAIRHGTALFGGLDGPM